MDLKEKRFLERIFYSRVSLVVVSVFVFLMGRAVFGVYSEARMTEDNKNTAEKHLAELKESEQKITYEISDLSTPDGKEREIRDKFQVVKNGEKMVMIVNDKDKKASGTQDKEGFWNKIKSFFGF